MKMDFSVTKLFFLIYFIIFCVISKILFINVYDTINYVVDEQFHIPQGLHYCNFNFNQWDPKITTLPGLYLFSSALLAPFNYCTIYGLRLTNLIAAFINLPLFVCLFHFEYDGTKPLSWVALLSGMSMGILPPLYFFSHLYYTDTLSVTTILLMIYLSKKKCFLLSSFIGGFSILVRQTNVIFVAMTFGEHLLNIFVNINKKSRSKKIQNRLDFMSIYESTKKFFKNGIDLNKLTYENHKTIFSFSVVLFAFVVFVIINGSIVVGDKTSHKASIHIPQLFYFSLFCIIFAWPHFLLEIFPFIKFIFRKKFLFFSFVASFFSIVHYNTLVHPYLLADNRHYSFYIWMRIYQKYVFAKYLLIFAYIFGIYAALKRTAPIKNFGFLLIYIPLVILVLVPQKLLDVRYFITPFLLLRLKFKTRNILLLLFEFSTYLVINFFTFSLFFTKEIKWDDYEEMQRMIW